MTDWKKGAKYWDHAWNPVIGCEKVSEGCKNCYACELAHRFSGLYHDAAKWDGSLYFTHTKPKKKGVVFCGNMSDWFQDKISAEQIGIWIDRLNRNAVNLILTKHTERMPKINLPDLRHVWYGITAENQARLEERSPRLMQTGVSNKWVSLEPLLGDIHIEPFLLTEYDKRAHDTQLIMPKHDWQYRDKYNWVVVGAESGPDTVRRPCKIEWVESIVEQCQEWGVPVFVKQLDISGKLVKDISKFPKHLQIRQVPWGEN